MQTAKSPYLIAAGENRGRTEYMIDLQHFASDLATALHAENVAAQVENAFPNDVAKWRAKIRLDHTKSGDLDMLITTDHPSFRHNGRVNCSFYVNDVPHRDIPFGGDYKMPSITVSTDRPIEAIAKDVIRRGITAAIRPAHQIHQRAEANDSKRIMLDDQVAKLEARFPGLLKIEKADDGMSAHVRTLPIHEPGKVADYFYLWGRIDYNGVFNHERMDHMSPEFFADFLAVIRRHHPFPGEPKATKGIDALVDRLRKYVTADDVEQAATKPRAFLRMIADRINDDLDS